MLLFSNIKKKNFYSNYLINCKLLFPFYVSVHFDFLFKSINKRSVNEFQEIPVKCFKRVRWFY